MKQGEEGPDNSSSLFPNGEVELDLIHLMSPVLDPPEEQNDQDGMVMISPTQGHIRQTFARGGPKRLGVRPLDWGSPGSTQAQSRVNNPFPHKPKWWFWRRQRLSGPKQGQLTTRQRTAWGYRQDGPGGRRRFGAHSLFGHPRMPDSLVGWHSHNGKTIKRGMWYVPTMPRLRFPHGERDRQVAFVTASANIRKRSRNLYHFVPILYSSTLRCTASTAYTRPLVGRADGLERVDYFEGKWSATCTWTLMP